MTLKSDAKFEEKLTCGLDNDMRNMANFHQNTWMSQNWDFDVILLSKLENFWELCFTIINNGAKFKEELTCCFKSKLIINNAPLACVYPNTIKTYLTPNHLLFGRQLLCYSKITSAVIWNLTILSSTTDKINRFSNHFWDRWRHEYVVNLRETQRASKLNINSQKLCCASLWWKGAQTLLENCHSNRGIT